MSGKTGAGRRRAGARGFTLLEVMIVLVMAAVLLGIAGLTFSSYFHHSSARDAAEVFARDLMLARSTALRSREGVVVRFHESDLWYEIALQDSESEVVRRRFGVNADIALSAIDLRTGGDTVAVSPRGIIDLSGMQDQGALGEARFAVGSTEYTVYFNSMGASKVEER